MILYRPVGTKELDLIKDSGYLRFPPRLPEQPIFYPVLNEKYATEIASQWNVKYNEDHKGYVTIFEIEDDYFKKFEVHTVGDNYHQELWVPADELNTFNQHIVGTIHVISEFSDKCIVFYECWQMECCGTAFKAGDIVKWFVYKCNCINTPVDVGKIDYCYEAHDSDWTKLFILEGKVDHVKILYQKYEPTKENVKMLKPVDGILIEAEVAKGFDKPFNNLEASGYIAEISNYSIRPATKEEVTLS